MHNSFFKFMSAIDIDCYLNIRESEIGNNLSYSDVLQLFIINHKANMTISELAEKLNLSRPATTQKVNELEKKGYIIKTQSTEDKRVTYLSLSETLLQSSKNSKAITLMDAVDKNFSDEKKQVFAEVLDFMTTYLTNDRNNEETHNER